MKSHCDSSPLFESKELLVNLSIFTVDFGGAIDRIAQACGTLFTLISDRGLERVCHSLLPSCAAFNRGWLLV